MQYQNRFITPPIKGLERKNVVMALDIFGNEDLLGKRIVLIGGGMVGCETAVHLNQCGHEVTIVERRFCNHQYFLQQMQY